MPCEYKLLLCMFLNGASFVKGKFHPKMKMMSSFIIQVSATHTGLEQHDEMMTTF